MVLLRIVPGHGNKNSPGVWLSGRNPLQDKTKELLVAAFQKKNQDLSKMKFVFPTQDFVIEKI